MVHCKDSNIYADYVKCKICSLYLKHHKANSGTSHLRLHLKTCRSTNNDATCSTFFAEQSSITKYFSRQLDPPRNALKQMQKAAVDFVSLDLRPLLSIEGKGMTELFQTAINIRAKHGNISAKTLLPSRNTVKRKLDEEAIVVKSKIVANMKIVVQENGIVGVTTDLWSDIKIRHFISLTVHFVKNSKLNKFVLSVYQFEEVKTGYNLRRSIISALTDLGIPLDMVKNNVYRYFVTDQGSNIKAALTSYHREPCACHMIATVLRHTLQLEHLSTQVLPMQSNDELMSFLKVFQKNDVAAKSLATYFEKSALNNWLSSLLKQLNDPF